MNLHEQQKKRYFEMANEDDNKALWNQKRSLEEENTLLKKQYEVLLDALKNLIKVTVLHTKDIVAFEGAAFIDDAIDKSNEAIAQCTK